MPRAPLCEWRPEHDSSYSVVLLAVSDAKYMFTYISVGSPGRNNNDIIVENAFRRLKARFRRLSRMDNRIDISKQMIKTCILHNLCENRDDSVEETWLNKINQ
ncbi:uncharacterized protein [Centruroides vittatus]|uniref:uncharacterized protein n=1 Tax=Centruroides vittatus TaxID=120091 RepID=UPI003510231A